MRTHSSATTTFTIRIPIDIKDHLERLAEATHRTRSWLAAEAVASYVEQQKWQLAEIEEGMRDADTGRIVSHLRVKKWMKSWGAKNEKFPPT